MLKRTHTCGELNEQAIGQTVVLCGWVHRRRDHGGLAFMDLRDRWGLTQVVFNPEFDASLHEQAKALRSEFCVAVRGQVARRPEGTENPKIRTGAIEVRVAALEVLGESVTPPFEIDEEKPVSEELRYAYRYLDLRRPSLARALELRHRVVQVVRRLLDEEGFWEIETPLLTKSTPEGARDYLVPSRLNPGKFYALPQSPQLYKQLLMVSGVERYYQIARCFRDEDLRADRQPEFTQMDLEMSFVEEEDIFGLMERLFQAVWSQVLHRELAVPFPRLSYAECMDRYGSDKPDLRFEMQLVDLTGVFSGTCFQRFREILDQGGVVKGLVAPGGLTLSGKAADHLTDLSRQVGAKGLVTVRVTDKGLESPVSKHLEPELLQQAVAQLRAKPSDLVLLVADRPKVAAAVLGALRAHLGEKLHLTNKETFPFVWIYGFPLFQYNSEEKRWDSEHHPFTAPAEADLPHLEKDPGKIRARSYDVVVNGMELGSGSIRIHSRRVQEKVFQILGLPEAEIRSRFGFLLEAFRYGAPPHGGIALGLDRLVSLMMGSDTIRDVIAFPKTQKGVDLMMGAPTEVSARQLKELGIRVAV